MTDTTEHQGGCLCEKIRYKIAGPLRPVVACHCRQCQKSSGFHVAATNTEQKNLIMLKDDTIKWFVSSAIAKRAFCSECGSNLFWKQNGSDTISIFAGTLDQPTNLTLVEHIYVADKGDFYQLNDDLPKHAGFESDLVGI
jgi:hypothetical protein